MSIFSSEKLKLIKKLNWEKHLILQKSEDEILVDQEEDISHNGGRSPIDL
jgi:hypothetical protein